jgi:hypothetical protein
MRVSGQLVLAPSLSRRALIVALHALQHGTGDSQCMEDLRRAIDRCPEDEWIAAAEAAHRLAAASALRTALLLVPRGKELVQRLSVLPTVEEGGGLAPSLAVSRQDLPTRQRKAALGFAAMCERRGFVSRARLFFEYLVPTADDLKESLPIARRGRVGLAAGYIWRPFYLAARVPVAWWTVRSARAGSVDSSSDS